MEKDEKEAKDKFNFIAQDEQTVRKRWEDDAHLISPPCRSTIPLVIIMPKPLPPPA